MQSLKRELYTVSWRYPPSFTPGVSTLCIVRLWINHFHIFTFYSCFPYSFARQGTRLVMPVSLASCLVIPIPSTKLSHKTYTAHTRFVVSTCPIHWFARILKFLSTHIVSHLDYCNYLFAPCQPPLIAFFSSSLPLYRCNKCTSITAHLYGFHWFPLNFLLQNPKRPFGHI